MQAKAYIVFLLLLSGVCNGQDSLVFYSGFEENTQPVYTTYHISEFNTKWFSAWDSPDIFSSNYLSNSNAMPINYMGNQIALEGQAYVGFVTTIGFGAEHREWLGAKLLDSMIENQVYCIKLNISLADDAQYTSDNIGVYFSMDSIYMPNDFPPPLPPLPLDYEYVISAPHNQFFTNYDNWTKIELQYTAKGDEKYLYVGNFYPDSLTNYQYLGSGSPGLGIVYYYVDELSISHCSGVGVEENKTEQIKIYPNPTTGQVSFNYNLKQGQQGLFNVYNLAGQLVCNQKVSAQTQPITIPLQLENGLYIARFTVDSKVVFNEKLVVVVE